MSNSEDVPTGDSWWACPKCDSETKIDIEGDGPDRYCTDCDWSVTIPKEGSA